MYLSAFRQAHYRCHQAQVMDPCQREVDARSLLQVEAR